MRFLQGLSSAKTRDQLKRRFDVGVGPMLNIPRYGFDIIDPETGRPWCISSVNVSDTFVARYYRDARDVDHVLERALETRGPVYNRELTSGEEWRESPVYRLAYGMHGMEHVVEVPILNPKNGDVLGGFHFGAPESRDFGPADIRLAEAVARVLGSAIEGIETRRRLEHERNVAQAALELTGVAIVVTTKDRPEPKPNGAARQLLAEIVDAEERLYDVLARPPGVEGGGFSRRLEVELVTGARAILHASTTPVHREEGTFVTVLELQREQPTIPLERLAALTPREAEIATLVAEGLSDREIAERLHLSRHTVSQHVKRIYRRLDIDSRVGLTRFLLGIDGSRRS